MQKQFFFAFSLIAIIPLLYSMERPGITPLDQEQILFDALFSDHVNALISAYTDTEQQELTPLMLCIFSEQPNDVFTILVALGFQLEATNHDGDTALLLAVTLENDRIVRHLLNLGANPEHQNNLGQTAYDIAQDIGNPALFHALNALL